MKMRVAAGGVVMNSKSQIAVVNQNRNSWSLPKGKVEDGEDLVDAARREIHEETGLMDLELVKKLGDYKRTRIAVGGIIDPAGEMRHIHIFLFKTNQTELKPVDPENPEALWVDKNEVAELLTHPKDKEFFMKIKNQL